MEAEPNAYQVPTSAEEPPPAAPTDEEILVNLGVHVGRGGKLAGAFLLVNAALVLLEQVAVASTQTAPAGGMLPVIFDVVIGVSLLRGKGKWKRWAIIRTVLGMIIFTALNATRGDYFAVTFQILCSTGMLLLLVGNPRTPRIVLGAILFGSYALLGIVGLVTLASRGGG